MYRQISTLLGALVVALAAGSAHAQAPKFGCGGINPTSPKIAPIFTTSGADRTNLGFECMMWQNFVYLNWPAQSGRRGVPNQGARFGAPGPTVWETYKTADQTFLPNAQNPGPWEQGALLTTLAHGLGQQVANGSVRRLTSDSKVSRAVLANVARHSAVNPDILNEITQAAGGTLYDLVGVPVFYEVAMNRDQYEYVVQNSLYNATTQVSFAQNNVVVLPSGKTKYGNEGALEMKAAWKVLTAKEVSSGRFHAIKALIPGVTQPVTVGLVGFHIFLPDQGQGVWATFAQVDNAPVQGQPVKGPYNFYNPACTTCAIIVINSNPAQVVQITPDDASAGGLNTYMQTIDPAVRSEVAVAILQDRQRAVAADTGGDCQQAGAAQSAAARRQSQ